MPSVNTRHVLIAVAAAFLVLSIVAAAAPQERQAKRPDLPPGPKIVDPRPAKPTDGAVRGVLPRDQTVRARVGQLVELTVTADSADSASIDGLGLLEAIAPGAPARFSFVPDRPGNYPVDLAISAGRAGNVVVSE